MSAALQPLFEPATGPEVTHREYRLYGRTRFLVPTDSRAGNRGLDVFLRRRHRAALKCHQWWLRIASNTRVAHYRESELLQDVKSFLGLPASHSVLSVGTPGPHEKNTLVFVSGSGAPGPIVKVATSPAAAALLRNEAGWLDRLGRSTHIAAHVPRLLWAGDMKQTFLLVQSCRSGDRVDSRSAPALEPFLLRLQDAGGRRPGFTGSRMHQEMVRRSAFAERLGRAWDNVTARLLATIASTLDGAGVVMVAAHRDFAPWNIRMCGTDPWVFDWEYASEEYVPHYDLFHFALYPLAKSRVWRPAALQRTHRAIVRRWLDQGDPVARAGLAAYLLDVTLSHLERDPERGGTRPIVRNYSMLLDALGGHALA